MKSHIATSQPKAEAELLILNRSKCLGFALKLRKYFFFKLEVLTDLHKFLMGQTDSITVNRTAKVSSGIFVPTFIWNSAYTTFNFCLLYKSNIKIKCFYKAHLGYSITRLDT